MKPDDNLPDDIAALWSEVMNNWQDKSAHKKFIAICTAAKRLDLAGYCYRKIKEVDPAKEKEVEQHMAAIITASTEMLFRQQTPRPKKSMKLFFIALGMSLSMIGYSLWILLKN